MKHRKDLNLGNIMKIKLNGLAKEYTASQNLNQIISQFCKDSSRIIAEVNGEIVRAQFWEDTDITEGDNIELVSFVGGG